MRALYRNTSPVWYALFEGYQPIRDRNGNLTGDNEIRYENPVKIRANVSPPINTLHYAPFGTDISYDRTLTLCDVDCPITENSVLWINTEPVIKEDGTTDTPYDHVVKKIAPWKNSLQIAVQEVDVRCPISK